MKIYQVLQDTFLAHNNIRLGFFDQIRATFLSFDDAKRWINNFKSELVNNYEMHDIWYIAELSLDGSNNRISNSYVAKYDNKHFYTYNPEHMNTEGAERWVISDDILEHA